MKFLKSAILGSVMAIALSSTAMAEDYTAADLGGSLTPIGAIAAGNADGSIPAWTGGITTPPAGYSVGDHHPDPYAGEEALFTITADNMATYASNLTDGQKAMLERYPETFAINVYPTHRSASYPQSIYDWSISNASTASLVDDGNGFTGAKIGVPFPVPENGIEAIWNHITRYRGVSATRRVGQVNPAANGSYTMIMFEDDFYFPYSQESFDASTDNIILYLMQRVVAPARRAGAILLVHETLNQVREPRSAWTYNPGQGRVRRAPNIAYDNPGTASDGMRTTDDFDMYNGAPNRYDWTLHGRREIYVPYNSYKLHSDSLRYDEIIQAGHLNPDVLRYEKHRVWVVEANLKDDVNHIYHRRVFYIDEDSWQIVAFESYDDSGRLWRVGESHGINYYEVPTYWSTLDVIYDLQAGRYTALGFDNQESMYDFDANLTERNFTPSSLRRQGRR